MRKVSLFIAMSLDGYIADKAGRVDWLSGQERNKDDLESYSEFIKNIDTVVMGWNTYYQIMTELSPDKWIYDDLKSYVITHRKQASTDKILFTGKSPCDIVNDLKKASGKGIWVCGGANIAGQLMKANLIDEYYISVIPTILGAGVRLFENVEREIKLRLVCTKTYNGITDLVYTRR